MSSSLRLFRGIGNGWRACRKFFATTSSIEQEWSRRIDQLRPQWLREETEQIEGIARRVFAEEFAETKAQLVRLQKALDEKQRT